MVYSPNMRVRGSGLIIHEGAVLLIEYYDELPGLHYVLPGGSVEAGETILETVKREVREEACLEVEVGQLVIAYEYAPHKDRSLRSIPPALTLVFACRPTSGQASLPDCPDPNQTGVRWMLLDELDTVLLLPPIQKQILEYAYNGKQTVELVEEWKLHG